MNIGVLGLWHLGPVTAACLAHLGHRVVAVDQNVSVVAALNDSHAPVSEPGLQELIATGLVSGNLRFATALDGEHITLLWITYDTTVDLSAQADADVYLAHIERTLISIEPDVMVVISSQLPVGSVRRLEQRLASQPGSRSRRIAYSPENLCLGSAVQNFLNPSRIVVGVRSLQDREMLFDVFAGISESIEWMTVESAEMTKHAINAFLAMSISFGNEIGSLCESTGADSKEVERGLKSEPRIGGRAYVSAGAAFSGGTLARDVSYLNNAAERLGISTPLLASVLPSNDAHKRWAQQRLLSEFKHLSGKRIAVWGLTYKPGTETLRDSLAVELCDWLLQQGAIVQVHDPLVRDLPPHWHGSVERFHEPVAALYRAHALVIATEWPQYRHVIDGSLDGWDHLVVLDANRFLPELAMVRGLQYFAVGLPLKESRI